tara:strand:+ start:1868 stop:2431 length:564 start_codon:yes stop_codon:yes gene_type:complete
LTEKLRPFKALSRNTVLKLGKFLKVESHTVESPDGRLIEDRGWLVVPDAVIVLAITTDQRFLCFRQIKYAVEGVTLAPVGGMIELGEDPFEGAKRELLEETGYEAPEWTSLGSYCADPDRGNGKRYLFLARQATQVAEPNSDDVEDQEILTLSREELETALLDGQFKALSWTAVVAVALCHRNASST